MSQRQRSTPGAPARGLLAGLAAAFLATMVATTTAFAVGATGVATGDVDGDVDGPAREAPGRTGTVVEAAYTTGYTWFDNHPRRSRKISHPRVHGRAGGTGTYADPITMAVGHAVRGSGGRRRHVLDHPAGTRFYLPHLRRYFVVEDTCGRGPRPQRGPCHDLSTAPAGASTWLDLWVGGGRGTDRAAVLACARRIATGDGGPLHTVVTDPPPGLAVVAGPLFSRGRCTDTYPPTAEPTDEPTVTPTPDPTPDPSPHDPTGSPGRSPLSGWQWYVDPDGPAARQARQWAQEGRLEDAELVGRIAAQPRAVWVVDPSGLAVAARTLDAAERRGEAVVLVLYLVPQRDCGSWSSGGAADAASYRRLVAELAATIGERRALVVVEPDAVPLAVGGCAGLPSAGARYALLAEAVRTLAALPATRVYLDAGHAGWHEPERLVEPLRASGVAEADGFALNVSNFETTAASTAYGTRLAQRLGGAHFVIDTSRNGNGPLVADPTGPTWCNPAGRALGAAPTTDTGHPLVDAWLWVKPPGESDGSCRGGEPPAGTWWPAYALELARRAAW